MLGGSYIVSQEVTKCQQAFRNSLGFFAYQNKWILKWGEIISDAVAERTCCKCGKSYPLTTDNFQWEKGRQRFKYACRSCERERYKLYYKNHKESVNEKNKRNYAKDPSAHRERCKKWEKNNQYIKEVRKKYARNRMDDPVFRLSLCVRQIVYQSFKRRGVSKNTKSALITGLSSAELTDYLLSTFQNNYGREWDGAEEVDIDHIIPISTAKTAEDVIRLCHYENLQLLLKHDNRSKGKKTEWELTKGR